MAKLNIKRVIESPDGNKEYLTLYTTLEEVNGLGKAFEIPNIGKAYYGIGEVTDPQASAKKRFNINGTVMAALKEVTTRYYSKYFLCDIGDNDIVLPPDAISVEYTLIGAGSGMAIFNNHIYYSENDAKINATDYNKFVKDINKIYPNGINGGSILSGSATKLSLVNADDSVKEVATAKGGILEIYSANLSTPTSKTTNNLLFDSNKVNFDKEVLEFKNTANSNYRPGIINKLIGRNVSRNSSVSEDTNKELPINIGNEYESLIKNKLGITDKDINYFIPLRTNKGCTVYNKMGPYIKTLLSYSKSENTDQKSILSAIGTNSANYFKGLISNETIFPGKFLSKHLNGFKLTNDDIGEIPQLPKIINPNYTENYTFNEFGLNADNESEFFNKLFTNSVDTGSINGNEIYYYSDNSGVVSKLKALAKTNINSNTRTDGFINQFYKNISTRAFNIDAIGGKRIKFNGVTTSFNNLNKYFDQDTLNCEFTVGSNLKLDYSFYFGQLQTFFNETNDKYDFTNDDTFYKFNPFSAGCITGTQSEVVKGIVNVKGCKAIRLSIGEHGKIYNNKIGLDANDYFKDIEANGFAIIKINFTSNALYTASDEQYLNNLKYSLNNEYNSYAAISKDKLPFYGTVNALTCRETISGNKSKMSPKYTTGQIMNKANGSNTRINRFNPIIADTSEDAIFSNFYPNESGFLLDLNNEIIYPSAIYNIHDISPVRYNPLYTKYISYSSFYNTESPNNFNNFIRIMESDSAKYLYSLSNIKDYDIQYSSSNLIRNNDLFYINFSKSKNLRSIYYIKSKSKLTVLDLRSIKGDLNLNNITPDGDIKVLFNHQATLNLSNFLKDFKGDFIADPNIPETCISNSISNTGALSTAFNNAQNIKDLSMHEIRNDRNYKNLTFNNVFANCLNLTHTTKNFNKLVEKSTDSTNFSMLFYSCKKLDTEEMLINFGNHTGKLNMYAMYYNTSIPVINDTIDYSNLANGSLMYAKTTLNHPLNNEKVARFYFTDKMASIFSETTFSDINFTQKLVSKYNTFAGTSNVKNLNVFKNAIFPSDQENQPDLVYKLSGKYNNHGKINTDAKLEFEYSEPITDITNDDMGMKDMTMGYDLKLFQSNKFIDSVTKVTASSISPMVKSNIFNMKFNRLIPGPRTVDTETNVRFILSEKATDVKLLGPLVPGFEDKYHAEVYGINKNFELTSNSTYENIVNTLRNVYGAACSCMYNPNEYQKNNDGLYNEDGPDNDHVLHDSIIHYDRKYPINIKIYYQDYKDGQAVPTSAATLMKEITNVDEIVDLSMFTGADSRDKKTTAIFIDKKDGQQERIDFTNFSSKSKKILIVISNGQNKIVVVLYRINYSKYVVLYDESCRLKWASSESPYNISFMANKDYTDESLKSKPRAIEIPTNECTITFNTNSLDRNALGELQEYIKCVNYRRSKPVHAIIKIRDKANWNNILLTQTI
jgi:hypothetical protein